MCEIGVKAVKKVPDKKDTFYSGGIGGSKYYEFQVGQTYEIIEPPVLCESGFHYFRKEDLCFGIDFYEENEDTVFIEVEALGEIVSDTYKRATNKIKILRYIPKKEWQKTIDKRNNTGDQNSGTRNSGNRNSGSSNSGYYNSGHLNSGSYNSGNQNIGNLNSGDLNSGNRNSGDKNSGDKNSGDRNSGDGNSGNQNTGNQNSGSYNSGNQNIGNLNSGNQNSGNYNSGDRNSGSYNSGDRNSGDWNSGDNNSGNRNSGDYNSGDKNSGNRNLGYQNSGNWNLGDQNSGYFNPDTPKTIRVFGKSCDREVWEAATKPGFLYFDIKPGETYQKAFRRSWEAASEADRQLLEQLPNFDWAIFTEISGIEKPKERRG